MQRMLLISLDEAIEIGPAWTDMVMRVASRL